MKSSKKNSNPSTFAVIIGNRGNFPDNLIKKGRRKVLDQLNKLGHDYITLSEEETKNGAVENREDAKKCARLFRKKSNIDGIIISLPNFGDEKSIAETLRLSNLDKPILVHGFPDELERMDVNTRGDAFCGKLSVCNNLYQYGIPFTNTSLHVEEPESQSFESDIRLFAGVCRVVNGLKNARIGSIGARVSPFNTVRYSEKILERESITVETVDLSEIIGQAKALENEAVRTSKEAQSIRDYLDTESVPGKSVTKIAKLLSVIKEWISKNELEAIAVQCWSAIEEYYGVAPCTVMSILSESLTPAACEVDVMGALSMYALELASGEPSALMDWNNNYGNSPNKAVMFHCSNFPSSFYDDMEMSYLDALSQSVKKECTYGSIEGHISPGPTTFFRMSTDDTKGGIKAYVTEGKFTDDEVETFGGYGVVEVEGLQELLNKIVKNGFEHHTASTKAHVADIVNEAVSNYLNWSISYHQSG